MKDEKFFLEFFVVATPIGNLGDLTYRATEILREAELILCEDTRVSNKLLRHYRIDTPTSSYHQQTTSDKLEKIIEKIAIKQRVALITDAGTPGIADPGGVLIEKLLEKMGENVKIIPIPGVTALTALLSVAGINLSKFIFLGFPPNKKGRKTFFEKVLASDYPVVYYDSPYRVIKNLKLIEELSKEEVRIVIGREITKMFEQIKRDSLRLIIDYFEQNPDKVKGEFVVIVDR